MKSPESRESSVPHGHLRAYALAVHEFLRGGPRRCGLDILDTEHSTGMRALLRRAIDDGDEVRCAAVTLAEIHRAALGG